VAEKLHVSHSEKSSGTGLITVAMLAAFITPFMGASVNVALPVISREFTMNASTMSWVAMSYILASAVFLVPFGKYSDITGRKKLFIAGMIIFAIGSLLCSVSQSAGMLISSRVIQGIGSSMVFSTSMAIVVAAFAPEKRGRAIGLISASVYIGLSAAPVLGGLMTQFIGWRSIFVLTMMLCLIVITIANRVIVEQHQNLTREKFDLSGSLLYLISMSLLMYGLSRITEAFAIIMTAIGVAGMVFFVIIEYRITSPVMNIKLIRHNRVFAFSNLAALINYAATFAVSFILSLYLQYVKGLSPGEAGLVLLAQPLVMAIVTPFAGHLSDRIQAGLLASLGMAISASGLFALIFLHHDSGFATIVVCLFVVGLGFGIFASPNTNSVMSSVEKPQYGVASAFLGTMRLTGQMLSMAIATLAIYLFIGKSPIKPENIDKFMNSVQIVFIIFSLLCFVGIFASLARGKEKGK